MKKIIKIILITLLIILTSSIHSYIKAETASDFGDISEKEQAYVEAEKSESDPEIEQAVKEIDEVGDQDDNDGSEEITITGFTDEGSAGDEGIDEEYAEISLDDPDSIIDAADEFVDGNIEETLNVKEFNKGVNSVYNILLTIGIIVSLIWGVLLGIKFIFGSMEGKAQIKKQLIPYIIWVCVIFGSFIIWSIVVNTFQNNL